MRAFIVLAASGWMLSGALRGAAEETPPAPATPQQVAQLIADLGSDEYTRREAATEALTQVGLPAYAALEAAALHPDREVRYRSQRILGLIRQYDLQRRLEAFLSGRESQHDYPLPGWKRFQASYGDDAAGRALFVEIQRADPELMQLLEAGAGEAGEALAQRAAQYQQALQFGVQNLSLGQIAASLFVAAEKDVQLPSRTLSVLFSHCYQPAFRDALAGGARREIPRKMLGAMIRQSDDEAAYQAMNVAFQFNLPEGIVPAEKVLANPVGVRAAHMVQFALMTVARLGTATHLPLVEKYLSDATPVSRMQENQTLYDVQVRDAALAAAVLLTKQDLSAFFDVPAGQPLSDPQMIFFNARLIGFSSEDKRQAVFAKWAKYKASVRQP